jgi:hypothetical protein
MHPEIVFEDDVEALLREHEGLARILLEDKEAGRCEIGPRLFDELESLRAKRELEESGRQKDLLLKELNHRVKNNLQIVSSLAFASQNRPHSDQFDNAAARPGHRHRPPTASQI